MPQSYYLPVKYGPISIGQEVEAFREICYQFGYGRTITVMYACDELDHNGVVLSEEKILVVKDWIIDEWEDRVILDQHSPKLDMFKTLNEVDGVNIAIMPDQYDCGLKSSCHYLYDKLNQLVQLASFGRVWIVEVEILEQRESYGFKTERYFSAINKIS